MTDLERETIAEKFLHMEPKKKLLSMMDRMDVWDAVEISCDEHMDKLARAFKLLPNNPKSPFLVVILQAHDD